MQKGLEILGKNLLLLQTSSAFVGLVSILVNFYQWHVKVKNDIDEEEREQLYDEIEYYRIKFRNDENEIDHAKEELRKLKAMKR